MVDRDTVYALTGALFVLLSLVPMPVSAQSAPTHSVLLDTGSEQVATVGIDGSNYTVYRIENGLPYASGYEVYAGGNRVTERARVQQVASAVAADRVLSRLSFNVSGVRAASVTGQSSAQSTFRTVGWQKAARQLTAEDIQTLRDIRGTVSEIDRLVSPPLSALNRVLSTIDRMKQVGIGPISAWDVATRVAPQLSRFESTARELQSQLQDWNSAAESVRSNLGDVITSLERMQNGEEVDYSTFSQKFANAATALGQLESESSDVRTRLEEVASTTQSIADSISSSRASRFAGPFQSLAGTLSSTAGRIQQFEQRIAQKRSQLQSVRNTAISTKERLLSDWQSERSSVMSGWQARQTADVRVYGTLAGVPLLLAASGFVVRRRRRDEDVLPGSRSEPVESHADGEEPSGPGVPPPGDPQESTGDAFGEPAGTRGTARNEGPRPRDGAAPNVGGATAGDAVGRADDQRGPDPPDEPRPGREPAADSQQGDEPGRPPAEGGSGGSTETEDAPEPGSHPEPETAPDQPGTPSEGQPEDPLPSDSLARAETLVSRVQERPRVDHVDELADLLTDPDNTVRTEALVGFRYVAQEYPSAVGENVEMLGDVLTDGSATDRGREAAAETLRRLAETRPDAVASVTDDVLALLENDDPQMRTAACKILENAGDESMLDRLREIKAEDSNFGVRTAANRAIHEIQS